MAMQRREVFMLDAPEKHLQYHHEIVAVSGSKSGIEGYRAHLLLAIAQYSAGESLEQVRLSVQQAVARLAADTGAEPIALQDLEQYCLALWGLSLSIVFGDASPVFALRMAGQDQLMDRLLGMTGTQLRGDAPLLHPTPYQSLMAAIDGPEDRLSAIGSYLTNWYAALAPTSWFDQHLQQSPAFFGYWAFELAAVVKALNISDNRFADNHFYPRDLVHQRLFRTWLDSPEGEMERQGSALLTAKDRLQDAKELLGAFFAGAGDPAPAQSALQDSLAFLGQFLGSDTDDLAQNPEKMRAGLLQIAQAITAISTSTLAIAAGKTSPEQQQVVAAFKAIEEEIAKDAPELAELNEELRQQALANADSSTLNQHLHAAQSRLESTQSAFEDLLKNQALSLDELLTGLERLVKDIGPQLGIAPRPRRDTYAEVSKEVGKALDEANKKNMIQEDFDWSTIWKKD